MQVFGVRATDGYVRSMGLPDAIASALVSSRRPLADAWTGVQIEPQWVDQYSGTRLREADLLRAAMGVLLLSKRAVASLGPMLCRDGELLPASMGEREMFVYHPVGAETAIDISATEVRFRGSVMALIDVPPEHWHVCSVRSIRFVPAMVASRACIGPLGSSPWIAFVTDAVAERIRRDELAGVTLEPVWDDPAPAVSPGKPRHPLPDTSTANPSSPRLPAYKVLIDGRSPVESSFAWPLPRADGAPGDWVSVDRGLKPGYRGLHILDEDPFRVWPVWGMEVFEVEPGDRVVADDGLIVTDEARLLRRIAAPGWWDAGRAFVEVELPAVQWFRPQSPPDPAWRVTVGNDDAGDLAHVALRAAEDDPGDEEQPDREALFEFADRAGRLQAAQIHWGVAWKVAAEATLAAAPNTPNGDLVASSAEIAELAADVCLLRGVLSDLGVPASLRAPFDALWDVYARGYVPVARVADRVYVVGRPWS